MQLYLPIAQMSLDLVMLTGIGLSVGILSGMFGIGGGFVMTPLLIFLGVPPAIATGTGAAQVVASSVSGAVSHWTRRNVDLKLAILLIVSGVLASLAGVLLLRFLRSIGQADLAIALAYTVLLGTIGTLMLVESIGALRSRRNVATAAPRKRTRYPYIDDLPLKIRFARSKRFMSAIPVAVIGAVVGLLTAVMGVGGGFLMVPALVYLLRVPTNVVIGTSVFQIVFVTAITTVLQAQQNHSVDVALAMPLMFGGVVGAQIGVRIADELPAEHLRILLALMVLLIAVRMAGELVLKPAELYSFAPPVAR